MYFVVRLNGLLLLLRLDNVLNVSGRSEEGRMSLLRRKTLRYGLTLRSGLL